MNADGKIGDKVGYILLARYADKWVNVDNYEFDTIGQAVAMLEDFQEEDPGVTFAIARLELAMISRPDGTTK